MELPADDDLDNIQLLKTATDLLLRRSIEALGSMQSFTANKGIFGQAAPFVTLEGVGRLAVALSQVQSGKAPSDTLIFSRADVTLFENLAAHERQRLEQSQPPQLPAPKSES